MGGGGVLGGAGKLINRGRSLDFIFPLPSLNLSRHSRCIHKYLKILAHPTRFERVAFAFGGFNTIRKIQLNQLFSVVLGDMTMVCKISKS